jgi:hypothetical protein
MDVGPNASPRPLSTQEIPLPPLRSLTSLQAQKKTAPQLIAKGTATTQTLFSNGNSNNNGRKRHAFPGAIYTAVALAALDTTTVVGQWAALALRMACVFRTDPDFEVEVDNGDGRDINVGRGTWRLRRTDVCDRASLGLVVCDGTPPLPACACIVMRLLGPGEPWPCKVCSELIPGAAAEQPPNTHCDGCRCRVDGCSAGIDRLRDSFCAKHKAKIFGSGGSSDHLRGAERNREHKQEDKQQHQEFPHRRRRRRRRRRRGGARQPCHALLQAAKENKQQATQEEEETTTTTTPQNC